MLHFAHNSDRTLHADKQSAQLLVGLGKAHTANGTSSPNAKRVKRETSAVGTDDVAEALAAIQDASQA